MKSSHKTLSFQPITGQRHVGTTLLALAAALTLSPDLRADPLNLSASYHADSRDYSTAGVTMSSNSLPGNFSFWGFTDFHGYQGKTSSSSLSRNFSEYRLSHAGLGDLLSVDGLGVQYEFNHSSPGNQNLSRLGLTYKHAVTEKGWMQLRAFPLQSNGDAQQLSLIFAFQISQNISFSGFADYNFVEDGENRWVVEPQISYSVTKNIKLLLEYRLNEFEQANSSLDGEGVALGISYTFWFYWESCG